MHSLPYRLLLLVLLVGVVIVAVWYQSHRPTLPPTPERHLRALAVLPFHAAGTEEVVLLSRGLPYLLATRISGNGDWRRVSPQVVFARSKAEGFRLEEQNEIQAVARSLGAAAAVAGEITSERGDLLVRAAWLEPTDRSSTAAPPVEIRGKLSQLVSLVDRLADTLLEGKLAPEEIRIARLAAVTSPQSTALMAFLAGEEQFARANYEGARQYWEEAVETDPQFALAYLRLAELQGWLGQWERALQARQQALLLSNRLPAAERELLDLVLLAMRGDWAKAHAGYRLLLSQMPNEWEGWCSWADVYRMQGDTDAARQAARQAAALLPQHSAIWQPSSP